MNQTELNKSRIAEYNKAHVNDSAFSIGDEWDESKHPRAANGQFGSGGATSAPTKASKAPVKGNSTPAAKPAAQAKLTSENAKRAKNLIKAAFNQNWINTLHEDKAKESVQKLMDEFWDYKDSLPKDLASKIYNNCWHSLNGGKKPSYDETKALIKEIEKITTKGNSTPVAKKPEQAKSTFSIPKTEAHESVFGGADGAKWEKTYKGYYKDCQKFDAQATSEELDKTITNSKAKLDHLVKGLSGRTPDKVSKMEKQMYAGTLAEYHSALAAKKSKE